MKTRRMDRRGYAPIPLEAYVYYQKSADYIAPSKDDIAPPKDAELLIGPNSTNGRDFTDQSQLEQAATLTTAFAGVMSKGIKLQCTRTMALAKKVCTPAFARKFARYLLHLLYQIEMAMS